MRLRDPALLRLLKYQYDECALCGRTELLHLHHVLFRSHGGDDVRANIVCLCRPCHDGVHRGTTKNVLSAYLQEHRPDVVEYLISKLSEDEVYIRFVVHRTGYTFD